MGGRPFFFSAPSFFPISLSPPPLAVLRARRGEPLPPPPDHHQGPRDRRHRDDRAWDEPPRRVAERDARRPVAGEADGHKAAVGLQRGVLGAAVDRGAPAGVERAAEHKVARPVVLDRGDPGTGVPGRDPRRVRALDRAREEPSREVTGDEPDDARVGLAAEFLEDRGPVGRDPGADHRPRLGEGRPVPDDPPAPGDGLADGPVDESIERRVGHDGRRRVGLGAE